MERKPGDWNCRSCQHLNFTRRDTCQLCGDSKTGLDGRNDFAAGFAAMWGGGSSFGLPGTGPVVKPGDWYCICGTHNFASRSSCFKCGSFKDETGAVGGGFEAELARRAFRFGGGGGHPDWKSGDWICSRMGCNEHNFASRMQCFRCNAPRDIGTGF